MFKINKKGMLDDFFDFVFTVLAMVFCLFFISFALGGSVDAKNEATLENLASYTVEERLLRYLHEPIFFEGEEMMIKDLILVSVNTDNGDFFEEFTKDYFEKNFLHGWVKVYRSSDYVKDNNHLFYFYHFDNFEASKKRAVIELPNLESNQMPSLTIVFALEK